jgi:hypothetical protein
MEDAAVRRRPLAVLANGEADTLRIVRVRLPSESRGRQSGPGIGNGYPIPRGVGWCVGASSAARQQSLSHVPFRCVGATCAC